MCVADTQNVKRWLLLGRETEDEVRERNPLLPCLKGGPTIHTHVYGTHSDKLIEIINSHPHALQADVGKFHNTFLSGKKQATK